MSNRIKTLKRELLANGKSMAYRGRAAAVRLRDGTEVIIMARVDSDVQYVVDQLATSMSERCVLDPAKMMDVAMANPKHLDFESEL